MSLRSFSFGGGQQSTAALVLAGERRIDFPLFVFANVGEQAEHPATLSYIEEHARPYAERMGIELVEVRKLLKDGTPDDLYVAITTGRRDQPIPVRGENGKPLSRSCTAEWKIRAVGRELRRRGASAENPATIGLGISTDEHHRARSAVDPMQPEVRRTYPLIDLDLTRADCQALIRAAGLPVPPPSSCWFCPNHDLEAWRRLRRERPDLFDRAVELEGHMNRVNEERGRRPVWFNRTARPLAEVVADQLAFDAPGMECDSGYCAT